MQCRHRVKPTGGVCATCLKQRLSLLSDLRSGSSVVDRRSDLASTSPCMLDRRASVTNAQPLKQLLRQTLNLPDYVDASVNVSSHAKAAMESEKSRETNALQSIAYLIEKDIIEAHRRHSDAASTCLYYEPADYRLLRSKSTSQIADAEHESCHQNGAYRNSKGGLKATSKGNMSKRSISISRVKPQLFHHHELQREEPSDSFPRNRVMASDIQGSSLAHPLLIKSKSTGWFLDQTLDRDQHTASERDKHWGRRSPYMDTFVWYRKGKPSLARCVNQEELAPSVTSSFRKLKARINNSLKTKEFFLRPLKLLFRGREAEYKPSFSSNFMISFVTPRRSDSSSSSGTQYAPDGKLHQDNDLLKTDDDAELQPFICGSKLHRMLSQVWGHTLSSSDVENADTRLPVDGLFERSMRFPEVVVPRSGIVNTNGVDRMKCERRTYTLGENAVSIETRNGISPSSKVTNGNDGVWKTKTTGSSMEGKPLSAISIVQTKAPSLEALLDASVACSTSDGTPSRGYARSIQNVISMDICT